MEEKEIYTDLYSFALNLAIVNPSHLDTGFLSFFPENGIDNRQMEELVFTTRQLLLNMVKQLAETENLNTFVSQLPFGMMFQYCFDKGVELMFHYIQGTNPIPTTFYVPDCMTNEGPNIPVQYQPNENVIHRLCSIFHMLKEHCKIKYPNFIGTEDYLFCFFKIATALGFLYCLEIKL